MTSFKRTAFLLAVTFLGLCPTGMHAMRSGLQWRVESVSMRKFHQDSLHINITVNILDDAVAKERAVVLQPFIVVGGDNYQLIPAAFYRLDNKGHRYKVRNDSDYASGRSDEMDFICGISRKRISFDSFIAMPQRALTDSVFVCMTVTERKYPNEYEISEIRDLAVLTRKSRPSFMPPFYTLPVKNYDPNTVRRLTFPLTVEFELEKGTYNDKFRMNERGVFEFRNSAGSVLGNPAVKPVAIDFLGYTDIVGSFNQNLKLCESRTKSLYDFISSDGFFRDVNVNVQGVGEDWKSIEEWIKDTYWLNNSEVNSIVFGSYSKDTKEAMLQNNVPVLWDNMTKMLFPEMTRFECTIAFTMAPIGNLADKWIIYNSNKILLSPKDYSDLIEDAEKYSTKWYDLIFDFFDSYPDCHEAAIDASAALLSLKDYTAMGRLVRRLEHNYDTDSQYYIALWNIFKDNVFEGAEMLRKLPQSHYAYSNARQMIDMVLSWETSPNQWNCLIIR